MKNNASIRATVNRVVTPVGKRNQSARETLSLRNLPDCLLMAYDGVSRRAFERFVARGTAAGSEIGDWRSAENDLFLPIVVELQETEEAIYAMASVADLSAAEIAVAVEDRWLLISGYMENRGREAMEWIDWDDLYSVLKEDEATSEVTDGDEAGARNLGPCVDSRPFCVVELPAGVDASKSVAVMADGVVAIRMPKVVVAEVEVAAASV